MNFCFESYSFTNCRKGKFLFQPEMKQKHEEEHRTYAYLKAPVYNKSAARGVICPPGYLK